MQSALLDYVIEERSDIPKLNVLVDIVNARISTGQPYISGSLMDQPYFLTVYIEPWIKQAYNMAQKLSKLEAEAMGAINGKT